MEILNMSGLPMGNYSIYFGVDTVRNGLIDPDHLFVESVIVTVTQ